MNEEFDAESTIVKNHPFSPCKILFLTHIWMSFGVSIAEGPDTLLA